jgi:hypothetical protein
VIQYKRSIGYHKLKRPTASEESSAAERDGVPKPEQPSITVDALLAGQLRTIYDGFFICLPLESIARPNITAEPLVKMLYGGFSVPARL